MLYLLHLIKDEVICSWTKSYTYRLHQLHTIVYIFTYLRQDSNSQEYVFIDIYYNKDTISVLLWKLKVFILKYLYNALLFCHSSVRAVTREWYNVIVLKHDDTRDNHSHQVIDFTFYFQNLFLTGFCAIDHLQRFKFPVGYV